MDHQDRRRRCRRRAVSCIGVMVRDCAARRRECRPRRRGELPGDAIAERHRLASRSGGRARTMRRPSGEQTIACSSISVPLIVARAPSGSWQPPPSAKTTRRSAASAAAAASSCTACSARRHFSSSRANLDGDDALTGRRHALVAAESRRDPVAEPEAAQSGGGEDQRVVLSRIELAQPGVDVAADRRRRRRRERPTQLRDAPEAARPDGRRAARVRRAPQPRLAWCAAAARTRRAGPPAAAWRRSSGRREESAGMSLALCTASVDRRRRAARLRFP